MLRVVHVDEAEQLQPEDCVERRPDAVVVADQVVAGRVGVAGVEADAHPVPLGLRDPVEDAAEVLEARPDGRPGAGGEFQEDAGRALHGLQRFGHAPGVAREPLLDVAVRRVPGVGHEEIETEARAALKLALEAALRHPPQPAVRRREVDEIGVVGSGDRDPVLAERRLERRRRLVVDPGLGPAVRLLGEELEVDRPDLRRSPRRVLHAPRHRDVGAEFVAVTVPVRDGSGFGRLAHERRGGCDGRSSTRLTWASFG